MLVERLREGGYVVRPESPRRPNLLERLGEGIREAWTFIIMRDAQSMIEYALLLMLIGGVVLVVLIVLGNQVHNVFNNVSCAIGKLGGSCRPDD